MTLSDKECYALKTCRIVEDPEILFVAQLRSLSGTFLHPYLIQMAKRMRPEEDPESDEENLAVHEKDVAGAGQEGTGIRALPRVSVWICSSHHCS